MKRLYVFIIVAALILALLAAYYFLRISYNAPPPVEPTPGALPTVGNQTNPPAATPPPATPGTNALPTTPYAGQKFGVVSQNKVAAFYVDSQNNALIVQPDGQVIKVTNGQSATLSSSAITNLVEARFSADGNKIVATFGDAANKYASIFDVQSKSWRPLPAGIESPSWSQTGNQIIYLNSNGDTSAVTTLDVSNPKAKPVEIAKFHLQDFHTEWLSPNQVLLLQRGSALAFSSIWSFDVKNKNILPITADLPGLDSKWNGAANLGLVFTAASGARGGKLALYDTTGNVLQNLSIVTLPSKCVFDVTTEQSASTPASSTQTTSSKTSAVQKTTATVQKMLYCAVPRDSQKLSISQLPDDYQKKALFTVDDFYKINLTDGAITQVFADQSQNLDATDLMIANQTLFFVNRFDEKLYAISLK